MHEALIKFLLEGIGPANLAAVPRDVQYELSRLVGSRAACAEAWARHQRELETEGVRLGVPRRWNRRYFGEACFVDVTRPRR